MTDLTRAITPKGIEVIYVGWDGPDDPASPRNWKPMRKWILSIVGFSFCSTVSITVSAYSISVPVIQEELGCSRLLALAGISLFTLTFGAAPLVLAPMSEVWGRKWIYIASAILFTVFQIPQALAPNIQTMLVARFISGIGGSSAIALVGGTLSDLYDNDHRGLPMLCFSFAAFAPTGLGPVFGGYVAMLRGFRLVFWLVFAISGLLTIGVIFLQHETRESVLLSRKARKLRAETGDRRFVAQADEERASLSSILKIALTRPVRLFFTEPVIQAWTAYVSFAWGVLYLLLVSIPIVFMQVYEFNLGQVGLCYIAQIIGSFAAVPISLYCDKVYHQRVGRMGPEARMYAGIVGGIFFAVGCWEFAWTSWASVHWLVPLIGIVLLYCGLLLIYLTAFNYLADSYQLYAASALSAMNVCRNTVGAAVPLFGSQVYSALGIHGAGSLIAGLATLLGLVPFLIVRYGGRLRARSRFAKEMEELEQEREADARARARREKP